LTELLDLSEELSGFALLEELGFLELEDSTLLEDFSLLEEDFAEELDSKAELEDAGTELLEEFSTELLLNSTTADELEASSGFITIILISAEALFS
jgi:hypothetical protein